MAVVLQEYFGQFYLGPTENDFVISRGTKTNSITLANALFFLAPYDGETTANTNCLTNHLAWRAEQAQGRVASCNCWYNHVDGLVRISFNGSHNITWTDTGLQDLLGFSGNQFNANTYVGSRKPRYVWRPTRALVDYPTDINAFWNPKTTTKYIKSKDGTVHSVGGNLQYEAQVGYSHLGKEEVIRIGTDNYSSFQSFYESVIQSGYPIRIFPDRTITNSDGMHQACWGDEDVPDFAALAKRNIQRYQGFWGVTLKFWKWV